MARPAAHTVAIVTGTRAEFGLLRPVIDAVRAHPRLTARVIVAGVHLLPPARTLREVAAAYPIAARVPMQTPARTGRHADALATARGLAGFARAFARIKPRWVVVLGDRIEAFAAASAASIAGLGVCHIHGGDRAEGQADEALRHAITKLAHLHCAASTRSAARIRAMGEPSRAVRVTGSPAVDGLDRIRPMSDRQARVLGDPNLVVLLHPAGAPAGLGARAAAGHEHRVASQICTLIRMWGPGVRPLFLLPNHDAGRDGIVRAWRAYSSAHGAPMADHLPRERFIALLRRVARTPGGLLVGNSSAGLIECAALGVRALNIGPRQAGREQAGNVINLPDPGDGRALRRVLRRLRAMRRPAPSPLFGRGRSGRQIADLLARTDPAPLLRKRNVY